MSQLQALVTKKSITATFSITLGNKFLLMLMMYQGKTGQSLPKVKFPDGFNLRLYLPVLPYGCHMAKFLSLFPPFLICFVSSLSFTG